MLRAFRKGFLVQHISHRRHRQSSRITWRLNDSAIFSWNLSRQIPTVVSYQSERFSSKWELPFLPPSSHELWRKERTWKTTLILMKCSQFDRTLRSLVGSYNIFLTSHILFIRSECSEWPFHCFPFQLGCQTFEYEGWYQGTILSLTMSLITTVAISLVVWVDLNL